MALGSTAAVPYDRDWRQAAVPGKGDDMAKQERTAILRWEAMRFVDGVYAALLAAPAPTRHARLRRLAARAQDRFLRRCEHLVH